MKRNELESLILAAFENPMGLPPAQVAKFLASQIIASTDRIEEDWNVIELTLDGIKQKHRVKSFDGHLIFFEGLSTPSELVSTAAAIKASRPAICDTRRLAAILDRIDGANTQKSIERIHPDALSGGRSRGTPPEADD